MSSLLSILGTAGSSLGAHRSASATASHNLENAATPGYARQRAELEATLPAEQQMNASIGRGVNLGTISQARDRFLEAQLPSSFAASAEASTASNTLASVSALDPELPGGLGESLGAFYSALDALSQNPSDLGLRQAVLGRGEALAQSFNRDSSALASARDGVDQRVTASSDQVNSMLSQVAELNGQIKLARAYGGEPNDLLDKRLALRDELARQVGAVPIETGDGDLNLSLTSGAALVRGSASAQFSTRPDPALDGHVSIQLTRTDGTGPDDVTPKVGGSLGGFITARDGALADAEQSIDQLAFDFSTALNALHQAGFAMDGSGGLALFDAGAASPGAASRISINALIVADPSLLAAAGSAIAAPGDNTNLLLMIGTERSPLASGMTPTEALARAVSSFGATAQRLSSASMMNQSLENQLQGMRDSISGVSIDEELLNLSQAQRAFEATMKVITTADQMLETLLSLK